MNPVIREKDVRHLRTNGDCQAGLTIRIEALEGYPAIPRNTKGFARA